MKAIKTGKREYLFSVTKKDFKVQSMTAGGPGGQNQNRVETAIRITHPESGAVGESRSEKSQHQNKRIAFRHLVNSKKFRVWLNIKASEIIKGETIEKAVERAMKPENIKTEVKDEKGKWTEDHNAPYTQRAGCSDRTDNVGK